VMVKTEKGVLNNHDFYVACFRSLPEPTACSPCFLFLACNVERCVCNSSSQKYSFSSKEQPFKLHHDTAINDGRSFCNSMTTLDCGTARPSFYPLPLVEASSILALMSNLRATFAMSRCIEGSALCCFEARRDLTKTPNQARLESRSGRDPTPSPDVISLFLTNPSLGREKKRRGRQSGVGKI